MDTEQLEQIGEGLQQMGCAITQLVFWLFALLILGGCVVAIVFS